VVFVRDGILFRQIHGGAAQDAFERLTASGLYDLLAGSGRLIPHEPASFKERCSDEACIVIRPERVPFLSYPYEWCFGQLKDAALLTLDIQREALRFGLCLKDASAYNVQYVRGKPCLIDTGSFARFREGEPWVAYQQFCQHFLAPLALMARVDVRLGPSLLRTHLDGVPLDLAARLLPARARLDPALLPHVFLHSAAQRRHAATDVAPMARQQPRMGRNALMGLLDSLEAGVRRLTWQPHGTEWGAYYNNTNYEAAAFEAKQRLVACLLEATTAGPPPERVLDLGANTGLVQPHRSRQRIFTLSLDSDPAAVETNYQNSRAGAGEQHLLPLVQDLTDPQPRSGLGRRGAPLTAGTLPGRRRGRAHRRVRARARASSGDLAQRAAAPDRRPAGSLGPIRDYRVGAQGRHAGAAPARPTARHLSRLHRGRLRGRLCCQLFYRPARADPRNGANAVSAAAT
jgi:hypothetical protein